MTPPKLILLVCSTLTQKKDIL